MQETKDHKAKKLFTLTGDLDQDRFLSAESMSNFHWELLTGCYHQGQCEQDCREAEPFFEIEDMTRAIECLKDYDLSDIDYEDDTDITIYYLWLLAGDLHENEENNEDSAQTLAEALNQLNKDLNKG